MVGLHHRRGAAPEPSAALPIAEAARPVNVPKFMATPLRHQLSASFTRQRMVLSLVAISGPLIHSLYGEWDGILFSLGTLPSPDTRVLIYFYSLFIPTIMIACAFPDEHAPMTESGAIFSFVPCVVCAILRCFGILLDLHHTETHVNDACARVHTAACAILFCAWASVAVLGMRRRVDWSIARWMHGTEGATFILCTLALHRCGPPPSYAPGSVSLPAALARGCLALLLSLCVVTPSNRQRMASYARTSGLFHVAIPLGELRVGADARRALATVVAAPPPSARSAAAEVERSASASDDDEDRFENDRYDPLPPGGSVSSPFSRSRSNTDPHSTTDEQGVSFHSHHTSKVGGLGPATVLEAG